MMKKYLLLFVAVVCAYGAFAQNNLRGKKVVAMDSVVTNSINARAGDVVTVLTALAVDQGLTVTDDATFSGNVTTNTLDVLNGTSILNFGATFGGDGTLTNNTNKTGRIGVPHYNNLAEESVALAFIQTDGSKNQVNIGGGSAVVNAATEINFYTAANTTTTSGTNQMSISSDGSIDFNDYGSGSNTGTAAYSLAVDASGNVIEEAVLDVGNITFSGGTIGTSTGELTLDPTGVSVINFSDDVRTTGNITNSSSFTLTGGSAFTGSASHLELNGTNAELIANQESNGYYLGLYDDDSVQIYDGTTLYFDHNATDGFTLNDDATFSGDMTFSDYGIGSNTGTAAYSLAVDASGNVIEEGLGITGSGSASRLAYFNGTNTLTSTSNLTYNGVALSVPPDILVSSGSTFRFNGDVNPNGSNQRDLGSVGQSWEDAYIDDIFAESLASNSITSEDGNTDITFSNVDLLPSVDDTRDIGGASNRWDDIYATNGTIQTSDERLKDSIQSMGSMIDKVMLLEPRTWVSKYDDYNVGSRGFVAQEVEQVFPELVQTTTDTLNLQDSTVIIENVKAVQMSGQEMTAILVKTIQEIMVQYETKVAELEARLDALEN